VYCKVVNSSRLHANFAVNHARTSDPFIKPSQLKRQRTTLSLQSALSFSCSQLNPCGAYESADRDNFLSDIFHPYLGVSLAQSYRHHVPLLENGALENGESIIASTPKFHGAVMTKSHDLLVISWPTMKNCSPNNHPTQLLVSGT